MDWNALIIVLSCFTLLGVLGSARWIRRNWEVVGIIESAIAGMLVFMALVPLRSFPFENPVRIGVYTIATIAVGYASAHVFLLGLKLKG